MSQAKTTSIGKRIGKIVGIILCCILGLVLLLLLGIRVYFRFPVREYYRNSEKSFVIPGLSDGMIHQGLAYDSENDTFFITGYRTDGTPRRCRSSQRRTARRSSG